MSQCVPTWDVDDTPIAAASVRHSLRSPTTATAVAADIPMSDYEVAELTWENGQLALHGLGQPRTPAVSKYVWEKGQGPGQGQGGGTLESIVNQATRIPKERRWLGGSMDALVPVGVGCSTRVGSCSGRHNEKKDQRSLSGSVSVRTTMDTYETEMGFGFTSTSMGSHDNTITTTLDDHLSVSHTTPQKEVGDEDDKKKACGKSSVSTKRSRAAAIHNQSERRRRDKINQRMKTLQKLVPNSSKTDKASMLDEVIEYLKQLQAQVSMMSRMNMPSMMLPMAMQQQLQMSMMANPMGIGMGMGMGLGHVMDINPMNMNIIPNPFIPMPPPSWDPSNDARFHHSPPPLLPSDPMTAFLSSPSQPMTMDAYSRMAALYQQMQQQQQQLPPPSKP